jgi:hypothetical protein
MYPCIKPSLNWPSLNWTSLKYDVDTKYITRLNNEYAENIISGLMYEVYLACYYDYIKSITNVTPFLNPNSAPKNLNFIVNGVNKLYQTWGHVSSDHEAVFMVPNILSDSLMVADFKAASRLKVRVYDHVCSTETHEFSMSGSTSAFNAVLNQK